MTSKIAVGKIVMSTKTEFKWEIPDFFTTTLKSRDSPAFNFSNAEWCLRISEEFVNGFLWESLYLVVQNPSSKIPVTFTLTIGYPTVWWQFGPETCLFDKGSTIHGTKNSLVYSLLKEKRNNEDDDSLVVYCHVDENKNTICQRTLLNNSITIILNNLENMLLSGRNSDVEIVVRDRHLKAHKNILLGRSPVFAAMFEHDTTDKKENVIKIEDSDPDDFQLFLLSVYTGKIDNLSVDKAISLYMISHKYAVPDIMEKCVQHMKENLSEKTVCDIVVLAHRYSETSLKNSAETYMAQNMNNILSTNNWNLLISENSILQKYS